MRKIRILLVMLFLVGGWMSNAQEKGLGGPQELTLYEPIAPFTADNNTDFTVEVKKSSASIWETAFVYKTYVNKPGHFDGDGDGINEGNFEESGFVNLDYTGVINVRITCNYCIDDPRTTRVDPINISSVLVRPLSKDVIPIINNSDKTVSFDLNLTIDGPSKLSIELNGNRHRNIHVFANEPDPGPPVGYTSATIIKDFLELNNTSWYEASDNEHIYIGGNEIIRGGIKIHDKAGVKITGRGIIDNQGFPKKYSHDPTMPPNYEFISAVRIRNSSNITIDGIIANDVQNRPINMHESNSISVKNVKVISRVIWGAGIYIEATDNVTVDNCFLRTTDDSVVISPMREWSWGWTNGQITNVSVKNSALYPDKARAIAIGFHGRHDVLPRSMADNINFENIDILEHDEYLDRYLGVISVGCGDENYIQNITFDEIRVEGFTKGSLLNISVEDAIHPDVLSDGYRIQNIIFKNLSFDRQNTLTEYESQVHGLNNCRYVNGLYFDNFRVNGVLISNTSQFGEFDLGDYVYDLTFDGPPVTTTITADTYYIRNQFDNDYLNPSMEVLAQNSSKHHTVSAPWSSKWTIEETLSTGVYKIRSKFNNEYLSSTLFENYTTNPNKCHGNFIVTQPWDSGEDIESQYWKFIDIGNGDYRIVNTWMGQSSLVKSSVGSQGNPSNEYIGEAPWEGWNRQRWYLTLAPGFSAEPVQTLFPVPNEADTSFTVDFSSYPEGIYSVTLFDMYSNKLIERDCSNSLISFDTSGIADGLYYLHIFDGEETIKKQLVIKH